ncbi:hypothetical protein ILYODFUR_001969 [Ilyodon furcidens]|uniref:Uncharacterized protein n=1 Tax=Ilyodon furcidens TaxID=33524 RepID=A0ABV0UN92_9TELE
MEIGALFKEMRASQCRPGSPAGPSTSPAEPRPSETCATFPGAAAVAPVHRWCQLISAQSLVELAAGIIKLQTGFRPRVPPRGETAGAFICQQLITATLTPETTF